MKVFAAQSDCCDLRAGAWQAPLSMGFLREASWSRLPFPAPGDLPEPGIKPRSPVFHVVSCIAGRFCTNWASWEAQNFLVVSQKYSYFLAVVWGGFRNGMRLLWFFFFLPLYIMDGKVNKRKYICDWSRLYSTFRNIFLVFLCGHEAIYLHFPLSRHPAHHRTCFYKQNYPSEQSKPFSNYSCLPYFLTF